MLLHSFRKSQKEVSVDQNKKSDDTRGEEVSAFGQRVKGAAKDVVGNVVDDPGLEREDERENAMGCARYSRGSRARIRARYQ